ncbi:hypothetical protein BGZ54_000239 [Gamsiella multidivaricata]|nr:hypothetical protein BGZ54_000239 [Gamsiella multidivaricata]
MGCLVSCSVFVPIPNIVVKSHQTLEAILPYLPLSLTATTADPDESSEQQQQLLTASSSPSSGDSQALVPSSSPSSPTAPTPSALVLSSKASDLSLRNRRTREGASISGTTSPSGGQDTNRISPDCSIPATTCIKISLQPTPTFKFVKPKCVIILKFSYPVPSNTPDSPSKIPDVVQVTGTFNGWKRSDPLTRNQETSRFEGEIPVAVDSIREQDQGQGAVNNTKKILFKFVLDGAQWVTDPQQELERDRAGNLNNVLFLSIAAGTTNTAAFATAEEQDKKLEDVTPTTAAATAFTSVEKEESEEERIARLKQEENDDAVIRQFGGGMWGAPSFAVNDPVDLPEHFVAAPEQAETLAETDIGTEEPPVESASVPAATAVAPVEDVKVEQPQLVKERVVDTQVVSENVMKKTEEEDEDDKIIKELGRGFWGTPYFQVNDTTALPEPFSGIAAVAAKSDELPSESETVIVTEKEATVVKDMVSATVSGSLIKTVVQTTEDTVIEDPDGTFLEESITTSVRETLSGELQESVTEMIETVEEEKVPASGIEVTETETAIAIQAEDGVETTVIEDTFTFTDGPVVDADSLHSLTTAVKPIKRGESFIVEQSPEVVVESPTAAESEVLATVGDTRPQIDESVDPAPSPMSTQTSSVANNVQPISVDSSKISLVGGDEQNTVLLQSLSISAMPLKNKVVVGLAGDAKPTADLSVATHMDVTTAPAKNSSTSASIASSGASADVPSSGVNSILTSSTGLTEKTENTEKLAKRKSIWKKIKKVLS